MKLKQHFVSALVIFAGLTVATSGLALADHHEGGMAAGGSKKAEHDKHKKHGHKHKKNCGHKAEKHGDHTDYEHDGHHHKGHKGHVDECSGPEADAAAPAAASGSGM